MRGMRLYSLIYNAHFLTAPLGNWRYNGYLATSICWVMPSFSTGGIASTGFIPNLQLNCISWVSVDKSEVIGLGPAAFRCWLVNPLP